MHSIFSKRKLLFDRCWLGGGWKKKGVKCRNAMLVATSVIVTRYNSVDNWWSYGKRRNPKKIARNKCTLDKQKKMDGWREKHRGGNISVLHCFSYNVAGELAYKDGITNSHVIYFRITLKEIYPPKRLHIHSAGC